MAAEAVDRLGGPGACEQLELSFFTAGTGGAGPTIVSATFLLLASDALTLSAGQLSGQPAWSGRRIVDFGNGVGQRACFLLDNPDVPSTAAALQIANCASRFGTAPALWNQLFAAMQKLPKPLLLNRQAMHAFSLVSMPVIRAVDAVIGSTNAMRIDAHGAGGSLSLRCVDHCLLFFHLVEPGPCLLLCHALEHLCHLRVDFRRHLVELIPRLFLLGHDRRRIQALRRFQHRSADLAA